MEAENKPNIIKVFRAFSSMNRSELSEMLGYSVTYLRKIEVEEIDITERFIKNFKKRTGLNDKQLDEMTRHYIEAKQIIGK